MLEVIKSQMKTYNIIPTCFHKACIVNSCLPTPLAEVEADMLLCFWHFMECSPAARERRTACVYGRSSEGHGHPHGLVSSTTQAFPCSSQDHLSAGCSIMPFSSVAEADPRQRAV